MIYWNKTQKMLELPYWTRTGVLTKTWNELKPAKASRNQPKHSKTSQSNPIILWNNPQWPKISKLGESGIFWWLLFYKLKVQMPKFGYFGSISINYLIKTKFCPYPISKVLISSLTLIFENFESKPSNLGIWAKKYKLSNLSKNSHVASFECTYFKSDIGFRGFLAQITK